MEQDKFGESFQFKLPDGKDKYSTVRGCIATCILTLMFIFYGTLQAMKLFTFGDTDIMESSRDTFFSDEFIFSQNMWFAFAITAYDSNPESIEDPSIGTVNAYYKTWGLGEDVSTVFTPIPTRPCTEAELYANREYNGESRFWDPHIGAQGDLNFYWRKFKCLDVDRVEI